MHGDGSAIISLLNSMYGPWSMLDLVYVPEQLVHFCHVCTMNIVIACRRTHTPMHYVLNMT